MRVRLFTKRHFDARSAIARACVALVLVVSVLSVAAVLRAQTAPAEQEWVRFEGSCSLSGRVEQLALGPGRTAAIAHMSGALLLVEGSGLGRGFLGEIIAITDTRTGTQGRAAWTDDKGDQVFSEFTGEPMDPDRRIQATIVGGTGRYEGVTGEYDFKWEYVVRTEEGQIVGRTVGLKGKVRPAKGGSGAATTATGERKP